MEDSQGFADFRAHRVGCLKKVEKLRVIHLEEHSSDLTSQLGLGSEAKCRIQ